MPAPIVHYPERPGITLKFVIVGGGLAGVAVAYTLQKAGHHVLVLERTDGRFRSRCDVSCPPNMTKVLHAWGLGPTLDLIAQPCHTIDFRSGRAGEYLGEMALEEKFLKDIVAGYSFVEHGDLYSVLLELALSEGASIRYNSPVASADSETGTITLESGEEIKADIIVGADGYDSKIRPFVTGGLSGTVLEGTRHLLLCFQIPGAVLEADEDLGSIWSEPTRWSFWLGEGYYMHGHLMPSGDMIMTSVHDYDGNEQGDEWSTDLPFDRWNLDPTKFDARVQRLLKSATTVSSRIFRTRSPLDSLVCERSRIVLIGEAAHPLQPGSENATALCMEDAQTLGMLFSRIRHPAEVSRYLTAYEEIRGPYVAKVHAHDSGSQLAFRLPEGPMQQGRDATIQMSLIHQDVEHMDEETFMALWGNHLAIYAHNATEQVEDWWGQYGSMVMRERRHSVNVEVAVSKADELTAT